MEIFHHLETISAHAYHGPKLRQMLRDWAAEARCKDTNRLLITANQRPRLRRGTLTVNGAKSRFTQLALD